MKSIIYFVSPVPPCKAIVFATKGTLDEAAVQYIRSKNGDERAENAYTKPSTQGYYLVPSSADCVEVRQMKQTTINGWISSGVEEQDECVGWFHVMELEMDDLVETKPVVTKSQKINICKKAFPPELLDELSERLKQYKQKTKTE